MSAGKYLVAVTMTLLASACAVEKPSPAESSTQPKPTVTETATATATTTVTATPSAAPSATVPTSSPSNQAQAAAVDLARQACQAFTDAYAVGPSSLYFPRAEQFAAAAAARDVQWMTLSTDIVSANRDHMSNLTSEAGRRAQLALERAVAQPCRDLGVDMVYHNGDPIGM